MSGIIHNLSLTSDDDPMQNLQNAVTIYKGFKMEDTASMVQLLIAQLQSNHIDASSIDLNLKKLQIVAEGEFATDYYRRRCMGYFSRVMYDAMTNNTGVAAKVVGTKKVMDIQYDRKNAYTILANLNRILISGSKSDEDKILGESFAYSYLVEGVYKKSVQDCCIWDKLASRRPVKSEKILSMDVKELAREYQQDGSDMVIFEGYDSTVRNAVAHSTLYYNASDKVMLFEDRKAGLNKSYAFGEIIDMYQKLHAVYQMILMRNVEIKVMGACDILLER